MPQSLTKLCTHLVFSTKHRQSYLVGSIRPRVHAYLAEVLRDLGCPWVVVGGVDDHVHLLFDLGKQRTPIEIVEHTKRVSSKFVKTLGPDFASFYWQRGYGMFSVSPRDRDEVEAYVRNQPEHHRDRTFQEEYRILLKRFGVAYDERDVWE